MASGSCRRTSRSASSPPSAVAVSPLSGPSTACNRFRRLGSKAFGRKLRNRGCWRRPADLVPGSARPGSAAFRLLASGGCARGRGGSLGKWKRARRGGGSRRRGQRDSRGRMRRRGLDGFGLLGAARFIRGSLLNETSEAARHGPRAGRLLAERAGRRSRLMAFPTYSRYIFLRVFRRPFNSSEASTSWLVS